jgi:dTDP-4-dehydrorhamnose reductase
LKVLLLGGDGQLGRHLRAAAPDVVRLCAPSREAFDLASDRSVEEGIDQQAPDLVLNAAAYTAVDRAETERAAAFAVNADGPRRLAAALARRDARLIQVSTDFVFAGDRPGAYRPGDPTGPLNTYGESKLAGERAASELLEDRCLVVRASWLYSAHRANFVKTMLAAVAEHDEVRVVADQVGSPTWAAGLAAALWRWALDATEASGVRHWADAG